MQTFFLLLLIMNIHTQARTFKKIYVYDQETLITNFQCLHCGHLRRSSLFVWWIFWHRDLLVVSMVEFTWLLLLVIFTGNCSAQYIPFFCDIRLGNRTDSSLLGSLFSMKTLLQRLLVSFYSVLILAARCPPGWSPFLGGNTGQKIQIKSSQIKTGRSLPNYSYVKQTQLGEINKITGQIRIE